MKTIEQMVHEVARTLIRVTNMADPTAHSSIIGTSCDGELYIIQIRVATDEERAKVKAAYNRQQQRISDNLS